MQIERRVEPEWLDELPPEDPRAARSRRDIGRLNRCMCHSAIMARLLTRHCAGCAPHTLLDLGGSDGTFALRLARRIAPLWPGVKVILVDRHDVVTRATRQEFARLGWRLESVVDDVFAFLERPSAGAIDLAMTNLFLHQFAPAELGLLLRQVSRLTPRFAACEPRRNALALGASRLVGLLGCAAVTRYDAVVS